MTIKQKEIVANQILVYIVIGQSHKVIRTDTQI